jgi:hypothetical protein
MRIGGVLLLAGTGPVAYGQTLPVPTLPPAEPTAAPPPDDRSPGAPLGPAEPTASTPAPAWEYSVGASAGYDTNVFYLPDGPEDAVFRARAEVSRLLRGTRGQLRLRGETDGLLYGELETPVPLVANGGIEAERTLTSTTTLEGDVNGGLGRTDNNEILTEQGILLPTSRLRYLNASASLRSEVGTKTWTRIAAQARADYFDDALLIDSQSLRGSIQLGRQIDEKANLAAEYASEVARTGETYVTHFLSLQYDRRVSTHTAVLLEGGASYTDLTGNSGLSSEWNFFGGAALSRVIDESTFLVYVRQEVLPAFGVGGLRLTTRAGIGAVVPFGRWELALDASHSVPHDNVAEDLRLATSTDATARLSRTVGRRFLVAAQGRYRRQGAENPAAEVQGLGAELWLAVGNVQSSIRF